MRNEMLNELKLEDLQGEARELAETIGMEMCIRDRDYNALFTQAQTINPTIGAGRL